MLLCLGAIADHQVGLTDVLVRSAMPRVERQRPVVMAKCQGKVTRVTVGEGEIVLDVRVRVSRRAADESSRIASLQFCASIALVRRRSRARARPRRLLAGRIGERHRGPSAQRKRPPRRLRARIRAGAGSLCDDLSELLQLRAVAIGGAREARELAVVNRRRSWHPRRLQRPCRRRTTLAGGSACSSSTFRIPAAPVAARPVRAACRRAVRASDTDGSPWRRVSRFRLPDRPPRA